jgi:hypothetical protein
MKLSSESNVMYEYASWNQLEGRLVARLAKTVQAYQPFSFSVPLKNPSKSQVAVLPQVLTKGLPRSCLVDRDKPWHEGLKKFNGWLDPEESPGLGIRSVLGAGKVIAFIDCQASELTTIPSASNILEIQFVLSYGIPADAHVTVLQLVGSLSPDTTQVIVTLQHIDTKIALKGTFIKTLGELTFTVPQPIQGGTALTFSFSLINPSSAQIPNAPNSLKGLPKTMVLFSSWADHKTPT